MALKFVGGAAGRAVRQLICVLAVLYLILIAISLVYAWPTTAAIWFENAWRDRPPVAAADNALALVRSMKGLSRRQDPLVRAYFDACRYTRPGCAEAFTAAAGTFARWGSAEHDLLARYLTLLSRSGWRESEDDHIGGDLFVGFSVVLEGQKLLMVNARALAVGGDIAGARAMLERDLAFWRRILQSADSLMSKRFATDALDSHFVLGTLVLRDLPAGSVESAVPSLWRVPISDAERSMLRPLVGEWAQHSLIVQREAGNGRRSNDAMVAIFWWLATPALLPRVSRNAQADHDARILEIMSVPLEKYAAALDLLRQETAQAGGLNFGLRFRDVVEKVSAVGDIEGVRRAALAAVTLRQANVPIDAVPAALAASALRNPYDNAPFAWDATQRAIVFTGLQPNERGEHRIYYY